MTAIAAGEFLTLSVNQWVVILLVIFYLFVGWMVILGVMGFHKLSGFWKFITVISALCYLSIAALCLLVLIGG